MLARVVAIAVAGWLVLGCASVRGTFGQGESKPDPNLSKRLVEDTAPVGPESQAVRVRIVRLHVYADQDYRREVGQWESKFRVILKRANSYLEPAAGVRLVAARFEPWTRRTSPDRRHEVLDELVALDPGSAQVVVVGLITNMTLAVKSFDEIGAARLGGSHMFLRNLNDGEEYARFSAARPTMSDDEKQRVYTRRKAHMEVLLLLHELGHIFGVDHEREPGTIMYPSYSESMERYTDNTIAALRANLLARFEGEQRQRETARTDAEQQERLETLGRQLDDVGRLEHDADKLKALAALEVEVPAEASDSWIRFAFTYQALDAVSATARAAARAGSPRNEALLRWLAQTRARFALPVEGAPHAIEPRHEPAYVRLMREVVRDTAKSDFARARARLAAAGKHLEGAPGIEVVLCDLDLRQSRWKTAKRHCVEALRRYEGASWAHYLMSMIDERDGRVPAAREHLKRAIELDPDLSVARDKLRRLGSSN